MRNVVVRICLLILITILLFGIIGILNDNVKLRVTITEKQKKNFFKVGDGSGNFEVLEVY